ncbi:MAG: hypothetical protein GY810_24785 [Aureispira sp.]|nr:hypothetical protein [Aureispira sp.]
MSKYTDILDSSIDLLSERSGKFWVAVAILVAVQIIVFYAMYERIQIPFAQEWIRNEANFVMNVIYLALSIAVFAIFLSSCDDELPLSIIVFGVVIISIFSFVSLVLLGGVVGDIAALAAIAWVYFDIGSLIE